MLNIETLSLQRGELTIFNGYSLTITGSRHCVVGINGSGKSSLLAAIAGLLPYKGQIYWQGKQLNMPREQVALASDSIIFPEFLTALDLITLQHKMWHTMAAESLIAHFNFAAQLHKTVANLSTGNHKKLQLILAFMRQPALLLLDEPNIALDNSACTALFELIKTYQGSILVASNEPERFAEAQFNIIPLHHAERS